MTAIRQIVARAQRDSRAVRNDRSITSELVEFFADVVREMKRRARPHFLSFPSMSGLPP